jgi:thiamine kinase-like enzyme
MNISKTIAILAILTTSMHISCGDNSEKKETALLESTTASTDNDKKSDLESTMEDLKQVTTTLADEQERESEEAVEEETKLSSRLLKGSENWDALLKSYEEYIDQYIKLMKKAKGGDLTAMASYAEYMQKAMDLQEKLEDAKGDLSVSQAAKLLKLQRKLTQAAAELY